MASPKTQKVTFKDGTEGRGVKLSNKNFSTLVDWTGGEGRVSNKKGEPIEGAEIRLFQNGSRQLRVAKVGDIIVKTKAGFTVIKADDFEKYISIPLS